MTSPWTDQRQERLTSPRQSSAFGARVQHHDDMSVSAAHASAFYAEAAEHQRVWGIRDGGGFPAPLNGDGERAMPFWSLRSRAERVVSTVPAYAAFEVVEVPLDAFLTRWLPGLERDGLRVGLNWSGSRATGYDMAPPDVLAQLQTD
ncbi:uncharacterized protein DUF2750 [Ornithinibacter aureus]|nr:uncharacterized protein DUF2750 [Ornithinibacter aureus]